MPLQSSPCPPPYNKENILDYPMLACKTACKIADNGGGKCRQDGESALTRMIAFHGPRGWDGISTPVSNLEFEEMGRKRGREK